VSFSDGHTCHMKGIGTVRIKLSDRVVRKLKDVRYVNQLKKNVILIRALEAQGLREILEEGILKMFNSSLVVMKGIRRNNLNYLKGSAVTENLAASKLLDGNSTRLWHSRLDIAVWVLCKNWQCKDYWKVH